MNELQSKALDLLKCFIETCDRLELNYYLVCGSALGAVKYSGFIPWDDDIDVGMLRADYERFLKQAPACLPEHYFLQNYRTDPAFPHPFSKLRDSKTTFIEAGKAHLPINHGIYIDIFPLDGYPKTEKEQRRLEWHKRISSWQWGCALEGKRSGVSAIHCTFFRMIGCRKRTAKLLEKHERIISAYPTDGSDIWCNHGNWQEKLEYAPKEQYGEGTFALFEGLRVRIPEQYDAYLTQKYGDWRSDPPVEKQRTHHITTICDPNRPYTHYLRTAEK
ncbi:MAG: LicD family protein [Oscillospiraceae bacterium]|nr:LicD family protein [Oscillospiraceae bacterium]